MKKQDFHSRSYGYTNKQAPTLPKETLVPKLTKSLKKVNSKKSSIDLVKIFLFPFQILGWILVYLWKLWQKRPKLNKKNKRLLRRKIWKIILWGGTLGILSIVILFAWAGKDLPDPDKLTDRQVAQSTKIYDHTGEHILYEIFADKKRTIVELGEIPKNLINGVIATEDNTFYEHSGIRPLSILRSFVYGIFGKGTIGGGASTLTQQLVKNAILTNERKINRKIKEVILSIKLEQKFTKDQILKIYFNEIPYGSTNYGVEAAAQSYFGKHVSELDLQESATLAGLPKAPSTYLKGGEALKNRRDFVLRRMYEEDYITEEEKNTAQNMPITLERHFNDITAPHFVLYVKEQLVDKYGEQTVDTGGLKVITTLDWDKQQAADQTIKEVGDKVLPDANANNASLVALDPKTGQILAMVGSRNFDDESIDGQFNVAIQGKRQPGSSFKPIVYTAAFEKGYTPDTVLFDVITNFAASGKSYQPLNYDLQEHGPVTMRQALQGSLNIPAVKTLYLVGSKKGVEFAERLGYTTFGAGNFGLSLVLGGGEVRPIEHAGAFGTFANNGIRQEIVSILKVEDNKGDILQEWKKTKGTKVLEPEIAATISNVLSDDGARAYTFGAGGILTLPDRPVATKTGTTNNYVDAWTVGYTPSLVAVVWAGNTNNSPMKPGFGGSKVAAPIWNAFMRKALEGTSVENFPTPPTNDSNKAVLKGSAGGGITLQVDKITSRIATSSTPKNYIVERTFIQPHSILHYVTKDDPQGEIPPNPEEDPQYQIWENAIKSWVERKKEANPEWEISFEEPPTEYDDLHSLGLIPTLEVIYPTPSSTITTRQIDTDIRVTAPRGVEKVTYRLDQKYVGVIRSHPFNLNYYAEFLEPGDHALTIIVEDDVGNKLEETIPFSLDAETKQAEISFDQDYSQLSADEFPKTLVLNHYKLNEIEELKIYLEKDGGEKKLIKTTDDFSNLFNNQILVNWEEKPLPGNYKLTIETTFIGGQTRITDSTNLKIK